MGLNPTGVLLKRGTWTLTCTEREDDIKRHGEKLAICKPRREPGMHPSLTALRRNP